MATRHYLPPSAEATPIAFAVDAAWEDTSILARAFGKTTKRSIAQATVDFSDANQASKDILFRQYDLGELTAGQAIVSTVTDPLHMILVVKVIQTSTSNEMYMTFGVRIMAADGSTVRAVLFPVTRVSTVASASVLTSRYANVVMADVDYTTVAGDHAVLEIGMGGDPVG